MLITVHCVIYFSLLQVKNKSREGIMKPALILRTVSMFVNTALWQISLKVIFYPLPTAPEGNQYTLARDQKVLATSKYNTL
jgi:hypothetical protein